MKQNGMRKDLCPAGVKQLLKAAMFLSCAVDDVFQRADLTQDIWKQNFKVEMIAENLFLASEGEIIMESLLIRKAKNMT